MNITGNRAVDGLLVLALVAACLIAIPLAANLGLLWLYIEPNPRHLPPDLIEESIGWAIIGLGAGIIPVVIAETVVWQTAEGFWEQYKGLVIGAILGIIIGSILGIVFAITQMPSIDGQAMETRPLAALAGGTAGILGALAGILAGAVLRRYILSLYRLPDRDHRPRMSRLAPQNGGGNTINGAGQPAAGRSSNAGKHP